jgi:hypothetical protein
VISRRGLLAAAGMSVLASSAVAESEVQPVNATGSFHLIKDWTFGARRSTATVHDMNELRTQFRFRYIYDHGHLDTLPNYWSPSRLPTI